MSKSLLLRLLRLKLCYYGNKSWRRLLLLYSATACRAPPLVLNTAWVLLLLLLLLLLLYWGSYYNWLLSLFLSYSPPLLQRHLPFLSFWQPSRKLWSLSHGGHSTTLHCTAKGQLFLKGLLGVFNSHKKWTKNVFPSRPGQNSNFQVRFFGELKVLTAISKLTDL